MTTPITTLQAIKEFAGIANNNQDSIITALMPQCLMAIGNYCNREFASASETEYRDGNGASRMLMVNYPLTAVSSVTVDGVAISPSVNGTMGYFYVPKSRNLILVGYKFTQGLRNVRVALTAGYGDASGPSGSDICPWPADLVLAYTSYLVTRLRERTRLGIGSQSLAGESVTYTDSPSGTSSGSMGIPAASRVILDNYANMVPETGL
jgi:hypothetical protein